MCLEWVKIGVENIFNCFGCKIKIGNEEKLGVKIGDFYSTNCKLLYCIQQNLAIEFLTRIEDEACILVVAGMKLKQKVFAAVLCSFLVSQ